MAMKKSSPPKRSRPRASTLVPQPNLYNDPPEDFVSFWLPECTYADVIREIAKRLKVPTPGLPPEWESKPLSKPSLFPLVNHGLCVRAPTEDGGTKLFFNGTAPQLVGALCKLSGNAEGKITTREIKCWTVENRKGLSQVEEMLGHLLHTAKGKNRRYPDVEALIAEIDAVRFNKKPLEPIQLLEGKCRAKLRVWNQHHPKDGRALKTFASIFGPSSSKEERELKRELKVGVQKALSRKLAKYRETHRER